ncbi:PP2C-domain-containing protein [Hypoxylon rubiginosum]|uniref:PP2C-domain-containing protein n=1 Tax=Hypoxylon rubiginosum TaxID=110542 RepID=A0ACB9YZ01_9PEZI|nr:PP2C-domain-containing protein [Hypoxylon rubiginosum]
MGQTLSEPVVDKASDKGEDDRLLYGVSAMQGWRISMEDAHCTILDLLTPQSDNEKKVHPSRLSFFGVFDGHGGDKVAQFAGKNIFDILKKQDTFKAGNYEQSLKDTFLATDRAILSDPQYEEEVSGCTACCGLITSEKIFIANAGDSRSVLGVKGRAKPLSFDHKPQNEGEKARITAAGGFVDFGRVNGNLALSRAIGDFEFKKSAELAPEQQIVTAYPDVVAHEIGDDDEFLVIACDGIWDCQSSQAVVEFVRRGIAAKQELDKICENMMDNCLASNSETGGVGCDNMTMVIVGFLRGRSKEQWYEEVASRVAKGDGPCAPPEYAEFRGPGVHHNFHEDSDSGYDVDMENKSNKTFGIGGYKGRIIFLGDGTEVLTDSDDTEMFDNSEEDKDLASQVSKTPSGEEESDSSQPPPRAPSPPPRAKKQEDKSQAKTTESTLTNTSTAAEIAAKEEPKEAKPEAAAAS